MSDRIKSFCKYALSNSYYERWNNNVKVALEKSALTLHSFLQGEDRPRDVPLKDYVRDTVVRTNKGFRNDRPHELRLTDEEVELITNRLCQQLGVSIQ